MHACTQGPRQTLLLGIGHAVPALNNMAPERPAVSKGTSDSGGGGVSSPPLTQDQVGPGSATLQARPVSASQ